MSQNSHPVTRLPLLSIGETARQAGCTPRALRYYEEQGLLAPIRTSGGQRRYRADDVERVLLYRRLIDAGLGTEVIRELLPCMNGAASADTVATLEREHARLIDQARELEETASRLKSILTSL
ncbi:MerR family transcriptional regulator [Brevibacterium atlanticum]|uniref:MerR family transcriptional regulator n=1 Tax=Brevibacterium atlanticum TaxID=2697563 RepID=UPI00141DE788|nr:MerR family transcriptional regulator [Brevibacterium atlanticum]